MARPLTQEELKQLKQEREYESHVRCAKSLTWSWRNWGSVRPLGNRAEEICRIAIQEKPWIPLSPSFPDKSISDHLRVCAYLLITHQPLVLRNTEIPRHEIGMLIWRVIQFVLFALLFYGIVPHNSEDGLLLSRWWIFVIFLGFTAVSAWCRFCDKWYDNERRRTAILNAAVKDSDVAVYLRSAEFAESMRSLLNRPNCEHKDALQDYLNWYDAYGKNEFTIVHNCRMYFSEEEYKRLKRVFELPHVKKLVSKSDMQFLNCFSEEGFLNYAIHQFVRDNDISPLESERKVNIMNECDDDY